MTNRYLKKTTATLLFSNSRLSLVGKTEKARSVHGEQRTSIEQQISPISNSSSDLLINLYNDASFLNFLKQYQDIFDTYDARITLLIEAVKQDGVINTKIINRRFLQTQATIRTKQGIVLTNQEIAKNPSEESIKERFSSLLALLKNINQLKVIDSGQLPIMQRIVFEQQPASYLIHELFCHLLEADIFKTVYKHLMSNKISDGLSIIDNARLYNSNFDLGEFDDCGNRIGSTILVDHGRIQSFLSCSPKSCIGGLQSFGGNGRCENLSFEVLPRMNFILTIFDRNYYVNDSYLIDYDYIKVINAYSGYVNPVSLEFSLHCSCFIVLHGNNVMFCPSVHIAGNVLDLISSIMFAFGSVASGIATCEKGNQSVPVGWSSPGLIVNMGNLRTI